MASPSGDTRILREPCEEVVEPVPGKWLRIEASDSNAGDSNSSDSNSGRRFKLLFTEYFAYMQSDLKLRHCIEKCKVTAELFQPSTTKYYQKYT